MKLLNECTFILAAAVLCTSLLTVAQEQFGDEASVNTHLRNLPKALGATTVTFNVIKSEGTIASTTAGIVKDIARDLKKNGKKAKGSGSPSTGCVNVPDYENASGQTCASFQDDPSLCDVNIPSFDRLVPKDACCACGGSDRSIPWENPKSCNSRKLHKDQPVEQWTDKKGNSCNLYDYVDPDLCGATAAGMADEGKLSANEVCCRCLVNDSSNSPSEMPSLSTNPSSAPSNVPSVSVNPSSVPSPSPSLSAVPSSVPTLVCVGDYACDNANNNTIGHGGCDGEAACQNSNNNTIGDGGCDGDYACNIANNNTIGHGGCVGYAACVDAKNNIIGDGGCDGEAACVGANSNNIGDGGCVGYAACDNANNNTIGDGGCVGYFACADAVNSNIGMNSCNCLGCCSGCSGTSVPAESCNTDTGDATDFDDEGNCGYCNADE